jgi:chromate transporter
MNPAGIQPPESSPGLVSLSRFAAYFVKLGALGFGGPIALAGHMQKDLVEERGWISKQDYIEGLSFSQLSPGPLAAQLAMYLGWVRGGTLGATVTGAVFILPSFLMVLALAALYMHYGRLAWIQGLFYGIGAAVIAIIAQSAYKLVRATIGKDLFLWVVFGALSLTTAWTESEIVWLFILCGITAIFVKEPPRSRPAPANFASFVGLGWLFSGMHGPQRLE